MPDNKPRKKIAILGGGISALASAFELSSQPGWRDRYEITVYQKGWRLGGKGASGRGESGRIEEHGLHCFWGFYDNSFAMLRACYDELDRKTGPIRTLDDAFKRLNSVWFIDHIDGEWRRFEMDFPQNDLKPGEGPRVTEMTVAQLVKRYLGQIREVLAEHLDVEKFFDDAVGGGLEGKLQWLEDTWHHFVSDMHIGGRRTAREHLDQLKLTSTPPLESDLEQDEAYRRKIIFQAVKFGFIALRGLVVDGIPTSLDGFEKYDVKDLKSWLKGHGADQDLLESPIVRGLYDASFCFPEGNFNNGNLAAGVSLRTILLMGFTYKGAFMWKMQASMGDVVFAPLYEALKQRGVKFEFFQKVTKLSLAAEAGRSLVDTIEIDVQAVPKSGSYEPLITTCELTCWPGKPRYDQLVAGDELVPYDLESDWCTRKPAGKRTLERGKDFDYVVLGIPIAALPAICKELIDSSVDWQNMVAGIKTIRTKSFQVWFRNTPEQQAWQGKNRIMTDVYKDDFNSVADMYQTLPFEDWKHGEKPGGVTYFSTAMADDPHEPTVPDDAYPISQDAVVEKDARAFLAKWQEGIFGWLGPVYKPEAYVEHYFRANINPDQRYTLSVANSTAVRIPPDQSGFDNLFLAGDWTKSPLDLGCAEGATMSGLIAGRGIVRALERTGKARVGSPFVEYPGMPVYPPAYRQKDITLCEFVLEADPKKMQQALDLYLNVVGDPRPFRALGKWVLLQTGHIASNTSDPPGNAFGTGQETSAAFLIPAVRWRGWGAPGAVPIEVGLFTPVIYVDHPLSLIAGREVFGMPKHLGVFEPDGAPASLDNLTVRTMAVKESNSASPVELLPLLHLRRNENGPPPAALEGKGFSPLVKGAIDTLRTWAPAGASIGTLFEKLLAERTVRFFALRQLRDRTDPTRATFQEITRGRMRLGKVDLQPLPGSHTIELVRYPSHRIAQSLGLPEGVLRPVAQVKIHIDEATLDSEL